MFYHRPHLKKYIITCFFVVLLIFTIGSCDLGSYIEIYNLPSSGETIRYVHIKDSSGVDWGTELLEGDTIPPGSSHSFDVDPGLWDVQVEDFVGWTATHLGIPVDSDSITTIEYNGIDFN